MTYSAGTCEAARILYNVLHPRSMRQVANLLNVSLASVCRWCNKETECLRRQVRPRKLTDVYMEHIRHCFASNAFMSSKDVMLSLHVKYGLRVSVELIRLMRKKIGLTRKRTKAKISEPSAEIVREFKIRYKSALAQGLLVSIDECGFDQRPRCVYGYAPKGQRLEQKPPLCSNHRRYNVIMGIATDGTKNGMIFDCTLDSKCFSTFLMECPYPRNTTILLDNVSFHKTHETLKAAHKKGYELLFLPPYSPNLNAIELAFAKMKNAFYKFRYDNGFVFSYNTMTRLFNEINVDNVLNFFKHVEKECK